MTAFKTGDTGRTSGHLAYRILADDLKGVRGPLVAAVMVDGNELVVRYGADGVHGGQPKVYDLKPPTGRVS